MKAGMNWVIVAIVFLAIIFVTIVFFVPFTKEGTSVVKGLFDQLARLFEPRYA